MSAERFMRRALALARRGAGRVSPNPLVGAVVVRDGEVVAEGWHRGFGQDHAEVDALRQLGGRADGCELYVNLEPCCHRDKKTPPCTDALLASGVRRVVCDMVDPNPRVSGKGITTLRNGGIDVETGVLEDACRRLNAPFERWITTGRPFVTLKLAATIDGRIAERGGNSRWISSPESRRLVHRMRAACDAVLVGGGTLRQDDPLLLPTLVRSPRTPLRVVLAGRLDVPAGSKLLATAADGPVLFVGASVADPARCEALRARGVEVVCLPADGTEVAPGDLLALLGQRGVTSVLVEGGAAVASSLLAARAVDRLVVFVAPMLLGDPLARPMADDLGIRALADSLRFRFDRFRRSGPDALLEFVPESP